MIRILALSLLLVVVPAGADYYGFDRIDTYDPVTGLYYRAVVTEDDRGFTLDSKGGSQAVNIAVFDPSNGAVSLLFKERVPGAVQVVVFEAGFKDGAMVFSGGEHAPYIKNNHGISKREPKAKLLAAVRDKDNKSTILYVADKTGANLKQIAVVPSNADWHLDVKNSKLRVVRQTGNTVKLDSYEW